MKIPTREKRLKQDRKKTILVLLIVLALLIVLIEVQTLIWLNNNKPLEPDWWSGSAQDELEM